MNDYIQDAGIDQVDDQESPWCECGAQHGMDEIDTNQCDCCGKPIE